MKKHGQSPQSHAWCQAPQLLALAVSVLPALPLASEKVGWVKWRRQLSKEPSEAHPCTCPTELAPCSGVTLGMLSLPLPV